VQAILLYALFGTLLAAMAGIVGLSVDTTQQRIQNQREMTRQYFRDVEKIFNEVVVPRDMEIPEYDECPDGSDPGGIAVYLCQSEVAQLAQWAGSSGGMRDTWGNAFTGYAVRRLTPVYVAAPNYNVVAPVTAMVLVSAGPDGRVDPNLQDDLDDLSSSSSLRDVLSISAPDPATCTSSGSTSCDDIVHTFSNQRALENRWQAVENAVDRIGASALRNYQHQFRQFLPQLTSIYANNLDELFDASGNLVIDDEKVNLWQTQGIAGTPTMGNISFTSITDRGRAGVDEEFRYITSPVSAGGSGISLSYTVASSPNGWNDILTIRLTNNGSPWGTGSNKTINYRKIVYANGAP
jgi:hypothetical protein